MNYRVFDGYTMLRQEAPSTEFPSMRVSNLRDAEGSEIVECDILKREVSVGVVEWDDLARRFMLRVGTVTRILDDASEWTVAGNAFEDGHLL